jgi:hypothetical protein
LVTNLKIDGKTVNPSSKAVFSGAGRLVADAIVIPFLSRHPPLNITELEPVGGRFVGKTVTPDGTIKQYSSGAWFRQRVASIPATIPALFKYLHSDARQRNVFLIRGAPANAERRRTRRQIAHIIHDGVDRGDHGFTDQPTALFFLDFDGVAGQWQADPGAVKNIVARLGAPYSDTDFAWFFSSKHGLKLDKHKVWRGKLSDTDVRVRVAFITARPINQAEAIALTKTLKARRPELKLDPAVSRLVQPNYIHRPRWQGHLDSDVLGDLPTIGWVQGGAKLLTVADEIVQQQPTQWSPSDSTIASHPDAEAAADAVGSDGSIRSHLMCGIGHLLQANPSAEEASVVAELRDMVEQRRAKIEPALKRHNRKWVEVQNYFPDDMARFATWWIDRNRPQLQGVTPAYSPENYLIAEPARAGTEEVFAGFQTTINDGMDKGLHCDRVEVQAARIATGVGKTQLMINQLAEHIHAGKIGPVIYAVPRHKLGAKIRQQFLDHEIVAQIFRGRNADDPDFNPGRPMCLNLPAVELALRCHADVNKTCCSKNRKTRCEFFQKCGYQRQMPAKGDQPQVWIVASDMLFHEQAVLGKPHILVIDEGFWAKGIRGIEQEEGQKRQQKWTVALDSMNNTPKQLKRHLDDKPSLHHRNADRAALRKALASQPHDGSVELKYLASIVEGNFTTCISREWTNMPRPELYPGMSKAEIKRLAEDDDGVIDQSHHTRSIIRIWDEIRNMFANNIAVSGRLTLKKKDGLRVIEWRGVELIKEQFQVKTMLMDATLPPLPILQIFHPQIKVTADISVAMPPPVHVKQFLGTPTTSNKLDKERHRQALRRYILKCSIELGGAPALVVCQQKLERYLKQMKLPDNIKVEHYNDISGLDDYKDVRLMILIGRTAPGPGAMEAMAAALSGVQPAVLAQPRNGFVWYDEVVHGIRVKGQGERGVATKGDRHPDPFVEAVRWQIHEGELMQALGRARGINRTDATPLDIVLLFDTCIPVSVNEVVLWEPPSLLIETAAEGVMLTSPGDMVKLWPELWSNEKAAYRTLENGDVPLLPGFTPVSYHLAAGRMKPRIAHCNLALIADPTSWLQDRLGQVTVVTL